MGLDLDWEWVHGHIVEQVSAHHAREQTRRVMTMWCTHDLHLQDSVYIDFANRCIWRISGKTGTHVWLKDLSTPGFYLKITSA